MRVAVEQSHLLTGLQAVSRAVAPRTTLPALSGIHLVAAGDALTLSATDLELAIQTEVPATVEEPGEAVLPARYLSEYVRRIPFGMIRIAVDAGSHAATLRWERSEYTIHGFSPADYPAARMEPAGEGPAVDSAAVRRALRYTGFAVSSDESKPALTGVMLRWNAEGILAVGCDGFRVAMVREALPAPGGEALEVVIPGRAVAELGRLLADAGEARFRVRDQQLHVDAGGTRLATRLVDAAYPDVPRLLPQEYPRRLTLERNSLVEAAERIALLADARQTVRWLIVLEAESDRLVIQTHDPEIGQAREEIPAVFEGEPLRIGLNVRYLLDGLRHLDGETLEIGLIDATSPIRLRAESDPSCEHVIFPIRM